MLLRQKELFKNIVEEYIKTAQPVGSKLVVEKFNMDISPATVRNDMAELEEQDLIYQPHTSAGRIPTEYGYRYYVENFVNLDKKEIVKEKNNTRPLTSEHSDGGREDIKEKAKEMAEESGLAVFVGHNSQDIFYTGLSNLFSQPEFQDLSLISSVSEVLDHLDKVMDDFFDEVSEIKIKIGSDNPFSKNCSVIMKKNNDILIGILGPSRMNYQKNIDLINLINEIL